MAWQEKRHHRMQKERAQEAEEEERDKRLGASQGEEESKPRFLQKMDEDIYLGHEDGLDDRLSRYRHTRQRNLDDAKFLT